MIMQMDELACFAPGMLTLGTEGASPEKASKYLELAKEVTLTVIPICCTYGSQNVFHLHFGKCRCLGSKVQIATSPSNKDNRSKILNCDLCF